MTSGQQMHSTRGSILGVETVEVPRFASPLHLLQAFAPVDNPIVGVTAGALILAGSTVQRHDTTTDLPRVAYYGTDLTWQQIEDL